MPFCQYVSLAIIVSGLVIAAATIGSVFVCTTMGPPISRYRSKLSRFNRSPVSGH